MPRDRDQIITHANDSDDEQYNEAEDEDFNPERAAADEDISSSSDDEATTTSKKRKADDIQLDLDSGDEATIKQRKTKKRKKTEDNGGSDGEAGSMIKTRAQRLAEKTERREQKRKIHGEVTIDVDKLWQELNSLPIGSAPATRLHFTQATEDVETAQPEEYITIRRKIKFAGQITEVEEEVLRNSDEAQQWLAEQEQEIKEVIPTDTDLQRPLRRFSMFEPNPLGIVKGMPPDKLRRRAPSRMDFAMAERRAEEDAKRKALKLNTMQKTQLDWKGFIAEQGLGDELKEYAKSKGGFLAREQFLDKVAGANELARRDARLKA